MRLWCLIASAILFTNVVAARAAECERQRELRLAVAQSNIVNANTTRTPEGGPYIRKQLTCAADGCRETLDRSIKFVYEPDHLDADANGYVAYPLIDIDKEMAEIESAKAACDQQAALSTDDKDNSVPDGEAEVDTEAD